MLELVLGGREYIKQSARRVEMGAAQNSRAAADKDLTGGMFFLTAGGIENNSRQYVDT